MKCTGSVACLFGLALLACTTQAVSQQRASLASSLATAAASHASAATSGAARELQLAKPLSEALLVAAAVGDGLQTADFADQMTKALGAGASDSAPGSIGTHENKGLFTPHPAVSEHCRRLRRRAPYSYTAECR